MKRFLIGTGVLIPTMMIVVGAFATIRHYPSNLSSISSALSFGGVNSWGPMERALKWMLLHPGKDVYQELFFTQKIKYQYPVTSLLFIDWIPNSVARPEQLLNQINLSIFFICAALMAALTVRLGDLEGLAGIERNNSNRLLLAGVGAIATLCFYPLIRGVQLGQIQVELTALFIGACYSLSFGRIGTSGFLIGLMALVKPQFSLFLAWGMLRRDWRFCVGFLVPVALGFLLTGSLYGFGWPLGYLDVLAYIGHHGETFYPNQSVNGILNRLLHNGNNLEWSGNEFAPYNAIVHVGTLISFVILVGVGLAYGLRFGLAQSKNAVTSMVVAGICFTAASPIAWEHHYGVLLPAFGLIFVSLLSGPTAERSYRIPAFIILFVSFLLSANMLAFMFNRTANTILNLSQGYLFFAALAALIMAIVVGPVGRPDAHARQP